MFDKLKTTFSNIAKSIGEKELVEKDIDDLLFDLEISLLESDVATQVIDEIKSEFKAKLIGTRVEKNTMPEFIRQSLIQVISNLFSDIDDIDLLKNIKESSDPYIILFVGINGTGKTTSLAKIAYMLQKARISTVLAASDTFRAGAIEQLREHAKRLNLKLVAQNYGSDPAAVARDAVLYAKSHKIDCVLIDTAGRMQTSKNLMQQIAKIIDVVKPNFKIFVGDSLAGNDVVSQAQEFYQYVKFDGSILTKNDADARGGAALSIVKITKTPILYIGIGQQYQDLKPFSRRSFLDAVFDITNDPIQIQDKKPESQLEQAEKKLEPTIEILDTKLEPTLETNSKGDDPFEGIDTNDINKYIELYDIPTPENDDQARELGLKIKKWIANKRLDSDETIAKTKKRSLFGRFRK